jgi:cobalt-zinc-cadmium efflux system protein
MPHAHGSAAAANRGRLVAVFALTLAVFVVELVGGLASNSLALLADAGHMFTDVAGIGLALVAIWFAGRPANGGRTFGYLRLEILAAVVNAALLFGVAAYVLFEAWRRLSEPPEIASGLMLAVALVGLGTNGVSLYLLRDAQRGSLNMRGAYLEVMGDLAGSAAVTVAAVVIGVTGWVQADAVASALIGLLIIPRTWSLLREAIDVLLEASPKGVDLDEVRSHILRAVGVADVHDLHAWTITSGMNVVSAHVVLDEGADPPEVLDELCRCLAGDFDIEHSTFQLESADRRRLEEAPHA